MNYWERGNWVCAEKCPDLTLDTVKTLTIREFFLSPDSVKAMRPGQSIVVTDNGKPALMVTKIGKRPRKTRADLERQGQEIFGGDRPKVNFTAIIRQLKK
jgi:hypothetical protein